MIATIPTMSAALDALVTEGIHERMRPMFADLLREITVSQQACFDLANSARAEGEYACYRERALAYGSARLAVISAAEQAGIDLDGGE